MTQEDLDVLAGFGAVWERVSGERMEAVTAPSVGWEELLRGLYDHWQGCAALTASAVGMHKKRLMGLSRDAMALFYMAQTEYFLETGDIFVSVIGESFASYTPYNLRKLCKNAVNLAEALGAVEGDAGLSMGDARNAVANHAKVLKELLRECLQ